MKWTKLDSSLYTLTLAQSKSFANAATLQKKDPHPPHVAPTLLKQVIVYLATNVRDFSANLLSKYGLCIYSLILKKKVWGRLPPTILAWDQTISPCVGAQRQGSHALHHLADTGKSKQLQWLQWLQCSPSSVMCRLCLKEKFLIMFATATATLNKRNEVYLQ